MRTRRWWHPYPGRLRPIWVAVQGTGRAEQTVRTWAKTGRVTSACDVATRELLVDAVEVAKLHAATPTRRRSTPAA